MHRRIWYGFVLQCIVQDPFVNQSLPFVTEAGKVIGVDVFMANSNNAFAFTEFRISPSTKNVHSFCRKDKICKSKNVREKSAYSKDFSMAGV